MTEPFSILELIFIALAAVAGGAVNAIAGGGTLITFPTLVAIGIPPIAASVTNTVALSPGYLGATMAQLKDLAGQERQLRRLAPVAALGGITGGLLLLNTGERVFAALIPYLILLAAGLLAFQERLRRWIVRRTTSSQHTGHPHDAWVIGPIFAASVYGGYFGAGLSVIILAVLALVLDDSLTRLNALKQALAFSVNIAAALFFLFSGQVYWLAAAVMAMGALAGGVLGGKLASRIKPADLRRVVVGVGVVVALIYLVR